MKDWKSYATPVHPTPDARLEDASESGVLSHTLVSIRTSSFGSCFASSAWLGFGGLFHSIVVLRLDLLSSLDALFGVLGEQVFLD